MKMAELKKVCKKLKISDAGKKAQLIKRIVIFIQTGRVMPLPKIPASSRVQNYPIQNLEPHALMLYGEYKNDAKTRAFFKKLIGSYFHFTAFGIDWLNDRWIQGKPPTYQEFADYWIKEKKQRILKKAKPKDEWAFIKFMQCMKKEEPNATKDDLMHAWKRLQANKAQLVDKLLCKVIN
jgi:hypothetical protein